jgi:hypothetical protein
LVAWWEIFFLFSPGLNHTPVFPAHAPGIEEFGFLTFNVSTPNPD